MKKKYNRKVKEAKEKLLSYTDKLVKIKDNKKEKTSYKEKTKQAEEEKKLYSEKVKKYQEIQKLNKEAKLWLTSRFPDAIYIDIKGLCKVVDRAEIKDNDYSLTPGRYVGVVDQIDEDFDYKSAMAKIKDELKFLNVEANELAEKIQTNLNELGL